MKMATSSFNIFVTPPKGNSLLLAEAESALQKLAAVFLHSQPVNSGSRLNSRLNFAIGAQPTLAPETPSSNTEGKYRALVEQIPAVVFMASHRGHEGSLYDVLDADIKSNVCATRV
jgi:hypothetical protein